MTTPLEPSSRTDLLLIRHGETAWNREHRFQGQLDVPLNAIGLEQARRLGERLRDEQIDVLVSSDLERVRQTAAPLAARHGLLPRLDAAWREQAFGMLEGLAVPEIRARHPELWTQWVRHDSDYALPGGGESTRHFSARVLGALHALAAAHAGQRIVVATHGGVLDMVWRALHDLPLDGPRACAIPNCGINRIRCHADGRLELVAWADADHLDGLPEQPSTVPASIREAAHAA